MTIAFIGDTHYCLPRNGAGKAFPGPLDTLPDHVRYTPMRQTVLAPLLQAVRQAKPDLVLCSGDVVEGGWGDDHESARRELEDMAKRFRDLRTPFLVSRGTHDANQPFTDIFLPAMASAGGMPLPEKPWFRHDLDDVWTILVLDYRDLAAGSEQESWLEKTLAELLVRQRRVLLLAHAPVVLWGRHFFGEADLIRRLQHLCATSSVEAFLCGHTHNQAISTHRGQHGGSWLQIMASSVGYPHLPPVPLDDMHVPSEYGSGHRLRWSAVEDHAPGFFLLDLSPTGIRGLQWQSVAGAVRTWTFGENNEPIPSASPEKTDPEHRITPADTHQIQVATLGGFSYTGNQPGPKAWINGVPLGSMPINGSYTTRRFLPLSRQALQTLDIHNRLRLDLPDIPEFVVGSLRLEAFLLDGRRLQSRVAPEIFVAGERWHDFPGKRRLIPVSPGQSVEVPLSFPLADA